MRAPHALRRGFTLVELMVALTGGLFLSMVVFALARDTNRFYQQQTRLANATLSGIVGFDRLRTDIARAGYLTTPNYATDPHVCRNAGSLSGLNNLSSIHVTRGESDVETLKNNGLAPVTLRLAGSFTATDEFPIRTVYNDGETNSIYLQVNTGPMARLGYDTSGADGGDTDEQAALLSSVFRPGRLLRIQDKSGFQHYAVIGSVTGGTEPFISLRTDTPLTFSDDGDGTCGLKGLEVGATANVVNIMQYEVRSLKDDDNYTALYSASAAAPYEADRTELVRTELVVDDFSEIDGTAELVAEYTVDFDLGFTVWEQASDSLATYGRDDDGFDVYFPESGAIGAVQRVRAVRARLSVRSREADRSSNVDPDLPGLYRIGLGASGGAPFARVRTFQADIALHNHGRTEW